MHPLSSLLQAIGPLCAIAFPRAGTVQRLEAENRDLMGRLRDLEVRHQALQSEYEILLATHGARRLEDTCRDAVAACHDRLTVEGPPQQAAGAACGSPASPYEQLKSICS
jgi:hypothetical protein